MVVETFLLVEDRLEDLFITYHNTELFAASGNICHSKSHNGNQEIGAWCNFISAAKLQKKRNISMIRGDLKILLGVS